MISGKTFTISFFSNGSIATIKTKTGKDIIPIKMNTPLWEIKFSDGSSLSSLDISREGFSWEKRDASLLFIYKSEMVYVEVDFSPKDDSLDISFSLRPRNKTILTLRSPILHFSPEEVEKVYVPEGLGIALTKEFFTGEIGWGPQVIGDEGLKSLVGEGCVMRPVVDEPVPIYLTNIGKKWLGEDIQDKIEGYRVIVNRPPEGKVEVVKLVDSPNGAFLSGYNIAKGWLFRPGGWIRREDGEVVFLLFQRVVQYLWQEDGREKTVAILDIAGGPLGGPFNELLPALWEDRLPSLLPSFKLKRLYGIEDLRQALNQPNRYPLIINPYGEYIPTGRKGTWREILPMIKHYIEGGGIWWETGGFSFFYELVPKIGGFWSTDYPPAFSDFLYLRTPAGSLAIYGIQRGNSLFVPVSLQVGRREEEEYGFIIREWHTYVKGGHSWRSPIIRMSFDIPLLSALRSYEEENGFGRKLKDKLHPALFEKLGKSVLINYQGGTFREGIEKAGKLPLPSLVHFADYLRGGFDKQYPDHLPPNPRKGTEEEFHQFYETLHKLGHLVMPYTNPTWWCDDPKGPTFQREGDAPLARNLRGEKIKEVYGANWGWAICPWHPSVKEAERKIRAQFTKEYSSDILFQDQIGARGWIYDTNLASPTPYAYAQGWINIVKEASKYVPLATEGGWDGIMNYETLFCGITWFLLPYEWRPAWASLYRERYPPNAWHFYPLAIFLAHDKVGFYHHDLGQFVTNKETLTWTLLLGYGLSYATWPAGLDDERTSNWLQWLSLLQQKIAFLYFGERMKDFNILRPATDRKGCGVMKVDFPKISIIANTDPQPFPLSSKLVIAPYGFYAKGRYIEAGIVVRWEGKNYPAEISFLREGKNIWIYEKGILRKIK